MSSAATLLQLVHWGGSSVTLDTQSSVGLRPWPGSILVQAVLVQPGWASMSAAAGAADDAQLAALARVPMEQLCPVGFVFLWAEKVCSGADLLGCSGCAHRQMLPGNDKPVVCSVLVTIQC
jgi:hypothetical protein